MPEARPPPLIELDRAAAFGKGLHRECFVHPDDPARCIKILVAGTGDENRREQAYYGALQRRDISWEMLPRYHGLLQTNLGEGAVFDLVRDYDGAISLTLAHYLASQKLAISHSTALGQALEGLKHYLLENRIITMTLKPKNILFQLHTANAGKLVIVDNIGNSDFIPLADYSARFGRWKIRRKWRRFEDSLRQDYANNKVLSRLQGRPTS